MGVELTKTAIDLGIVTRNPDAMLAFYRDTLGFEPKGEMPMSIGATMHMLACGKSLIKIVALNDEPPATAPRGGIKGATGYRYWTISVSNMDALLADCEAAGYKVVMGRTELRPGIVIAIVADPDGNWVEFLST